MTKPQDIKRIVVGVDGSPHAAAALDWAIGEAELTGAEVIAVYAIYVPSYVYTGFAPVLQVDYGWQTEVEREFEEDWCAPLRTSTVAFRTMVELGRPAGVIARIAEQLDADLVVVGRRGRGGITELLLGSVSHELSHHCKRPVVLISNGAKRRQAEAAGRRLTVLASAQES